MPIPIRIYVDPELVREVRRIADALEKIAAADFVDDEHVESLREATRTLRGQQDDLQQAVEQGQSTSTGKE
jgi:hypothetical protein